MKTTLCTWEDETSNRQIQFSVEYTIENGAVAIKTVTPNKVSFVCPDTNTVKRSVGVHTDTARAMLSDQFRNSMGFERLATAIANPNADTVIPHMSIRMDVSTV